MPAAQHDRLQTICAVYQPRLVGSFVIIFRSGTYSVSCQRRFMLKSYRSSTPEVDEVHAGRAAPAAAATLSMQQTASSRGAERLRRDAMMVPHPATAHHRVRTVARTGSVHSTF